MNRSMMLAAAFAAASVVTAGIVIAQSSSTPNGQPDIQGTWDGNLTHQTKDMTGERGNNAGKFHCTLALDQNGSDLSGTLTIDSDKGPLGFDLTGSVGNGNFWLTGDAGPGPITFMGKVNKPVTAMSASGVLVLDGEVASIKINTKKPAAPK